MEIKHICSTREEVEGWKVAQMHQRAALLESSKNKGRKRQRQQQTKTSTQGCTPRRLSLFDECTCSGGDEDEDEEDDDDDSILSGNFFVDDNEEIGHKADDFAFFARVTREIENREIDRKAEKEEESLDEEENPDDDLKEAETAAVPMTPPASKKNKRAVSVSFIGDIISPQTGTKVQDGIIKKFPDNGGTFWEAVNPKTGRLHARPFITGDPEADEQAKKAANYKRKDRPSNRFCTERERAERAQKGQRQVEASESAEKKEEAKKAASRKSSQKHREKQAPEDRKEAWREWSQKHRDKKKRSDEEQRKQNEEEAAREKAARAQADRQREARLLTKFQFGEELWLKQSRTGYSDSLFPVVMDDVEKRVAVPAANSTVPLAPEENHILERMKESFLFQQPLCPTETVECRGLGDEQTDHSLRHPFMTSWTAVSHVNFDTLYFCVAYQQLATHTTTKKLKINTAPRSRWQGIWPITWATDTPAETMAAAESRVSNL